MSCPGMRLSVTAFCMLLLTLPRCPEAYSGSSRSELGFEGDHTMESRNFLRFGKRNDKAASGNPNQDWSKREADSGPGEMLEQTFLGVHPHRSSPRSFLRFGKRFFHPDPTRPMMEAKEKMMQLEEDDDSGDADRDALLVADKRADNFLRFGRRDMDQDLQNFLYLSSLASKYNHDSKRSKDFLRFG